MKLSKNIILSSMLAVLILLAWGYKGPLQQWKHKRSLPNNFLKVDGAINKVEILNGKTTVSLIKEIDKWRVVGQEGKFFANSAQMKSMMTSLDNLKDVELEVASKNPDKKSELQTEGPNALKITLKTDKSEAKFNVGKSTASFSGSYVGRDGDSNTYRLNSLNLQQLFGQQEWRDSTIFDLASKQPNSLRLQYPDHEVKLSLRDNKWMNETGKIIYNKEQMDKISATLIGLIAAQIPKQDFKPAGLDKPVMIIQFKGDGFDETLMLGKKTNDLFYAKKGSSDNIYLISSSDFSTLTEKEKVVVK